MQFLKTKLNVMFCFDVRIEIDDWTGLIDGAGPTQVGRVTMEISHDIKIFQTISPLILPRFSTSPSRWSSCSPSASNITMRTGTNGH